MVSVKDAALSRSFANLDFQPSENRRHRPRTKSTMKRDLSQSCSAFNFIMDPSEVGGGGGGGGGGGLTRKSSTGSKNTGTTNSSSSSSKPSYSDAIMDATSKNHGADSPTSVVSNEDEATAKPTNISSSGIDDSANSNNSETRTATPSAKATTTSSRSPMRPGRTIPSSADMLNRRQAANRSRMVRSKSSLECGSSSGSTDVPLSSTTTTITGRTSTTTTSNRRQPIKHRSAHGSISAMHMSMEDFPDPTTFAADISPAVFRPRRRRSSVKTDATATGAGAGRRRQQQQHAQPRMSGRFSKSFSGFDDWDPDELRSRGGGDGVVVGGEDTVVSPTTPTRRRGKKPTLTAVPLIGRSAKDTKPMRIKDDEVELDDLRNTTDGNNNDNDNDGEGSENSLTELDLMNGSENNYGNNNHNSKSRNEMGKKPSKERRRRQSSNDIQQQFRLSNSSFDFSVQDTASTSTSSGSSSGESALAAAAIAVPKRGTRRHSGGIGDDLVTAERLLKGTVGIQTKVEKVKVSAEEFHSSHNDDDVDVDGDEKLFLPPPPRSSSRTKRESSNNKSRAGRELSRPRRTKSHDGSIRPIRGSSHLENGGAGVGRLYSADRSQDDSHEDVSERLSRSRTIEDDDSAKRSTTRSSSQDRRKRSPTRRGTSKDPTRHRSASKDPRHRSASKDPRHLSSSKDPRHRSSSKDPRHRSASKDPHRRSASKDPHHRSASKDPHHRSASKDPHRRSASKGPHHRSASKDPHHRSASKDPHRRRRPSSADPLDVVNIEGVATRENHTVKSSPVKSSPRPQRRTPRRTKSGDDSVLRSRRTGSPTEPTATTATSDGDRLPVRRASRRMKISDGGTQKASPRRTKSSDGVVRSGRSGEGKFPSSSSKLTGSLAAVSRGSSDRHVLSKGSQSVSGESRSVARSVISDRSSRSAGSKLSSSSAKSIGSLAAAISRGSSDRHVLSRGSQSVSGESRSVVSRTDRSVMTTASDGKKRSSSTMARRQLPRRCKSYDGSVQVNAPVRASRHKSGDTTTTKEGRSSRRRPSTTSSPAEKADAVSNAQRRAMAHSILNW